jgi:TorA maturation chaperone TorD
MRVDRTTRSASPDDLARTALERSELYGFLATIFREEMSAENLRRIRSAEFMLALGDAGITLDGDIAQQPEAELLEEMAVEYTALFLGPGGHISPYESVHAESGGALWGRSTGEVKRYIESAGFAYDPEDRRMPDHISVELEFMAALAGQEARAYRDEDYAEASRRIGLQKKFLANHLGKWAPAFCRQVAERSELPFYRGIARLAAAFLEAERHEIFIRLGDAAALRNGG